MPIKRRGFVKGLLATPALPLVAQQPPAPPQSQPAPKDSPDSQRPRQFGAPNPVATVPFDTTAEPRRLFFAAQQFAALEKLGDVLVPPLNGKPGASEAAAAIFLDFLISQSPEDRQQLYKTGLDGLNSAARKKFEKSFAELDAAQAAVVLRPLLVVRYWEKDIPEDPMQHFMLQAHDDLRRATTNSREWAKASTGAPSGHRGFNRAIGLYWNPIDPVVKG